MESESGSKGGGAPLHRKIFLVHGTDEAAKQTVARFLEKLDFEAIILHEQASKGTTITEKLEAYSDVAFAVVLLTPDDIGGKNGSSDPQRPRARQNVIFELGYFIGAKGRQNVCALYKEGVELPSDFQEVYVEFDDHEAWKVKLAKELAAAGFHVDGEKLIS